MKVWCEKCSIKSPSEWRDCRCDWRVTVIRRDIGFIEALFNGGRYEAIARKGPVTHRSYDVIGFLGCGWTEADALRDLSDEIQEAITRPRIKKMTLSAGGTEYGDAVSPLSGSDN